jgi:hypothetical protein
MKTLCAQTLCASAMLAGVYFLTLFGRPAGPTRAGEPDSPRSFAWSSLTNEDQRLAELCGMPACVELQESLARLQETRMQLMQTTAAGEAGNAAAAQDYRNSVHRFQAALGQVKERVNPGELSRVVYALCYSTSMTTTADVGIQPVHPWESGSFAWEIAP